MVLSLMAVPTIKNSVDTYILQKVKVDSYMDITYTCEFGIAYSYSSAFRAGGKSVLYFKGYPSYPMTCKAFKKLNKK